MLSANANTIPVCTWAVMEMVCDPTLLVALREEANSVAIITDPQTGNRTFDIDHLKDLPLLQSVYTEVMRRHVSVNITREVRQPFQMEGFTMQKGQVLQAPTQLAHYDESVWGVEGHPASEFWAWRHVKYVSSSDSDEKTKTPVFELRGRATDYFPYGEFFFFFFLLSFPSPPFSPYRKFKEN